MWMESNQEVVQEITTEFESNFNKPIHSRSCDGLVRISNDLTEECWHQPDYMSLLTDQSTDCHRTHMVKSPFQCTECQKTFSTNRGLTVHLRMHSYEKSFQCAECQKSFSKKKNLLIHLRTHSVEIPFQCAECEKLFSTKGGLLVHLRVHSGERPFKCTECKKSFNQKPHLKKHQIIHLEEKRYGCTKCGSYFTQEVQLISHQKEHLSRATLNPCNEQEKACGLQSNCTEHQTSLEKYNHCHECKKSSRQFNDHIRFHRTCKGERLRECTECDKIFAENTHHIMQQQNHSGQGTGKTHTVLARLLEVSIPNEYFDLKY